MSHTTAEQFGLTGIGPLNIIAADVIGGPDARPIQCTGSLTDDMFENDGQLTKREVRAITLSALAPSPGDLLWDAGLGSGSVAIEWLLSHPANKAIGIERDDVRAARAARNAVSLGVPHLDIRNAAIPDAFADLATPDAIFLGGGVSGEGMIAGAWQALKPGGRLVANGVTLETEAALITAHATFGGSLTRISIERAVPVGSKTGWRAAMPVMQWAVRKPGATS